MVCDERARVYSVMVLARPLYGGCVCHVLFPCQSHDVFPCLVAVVAGLNTPHAPPLHTVREKMMISVVRK